jgi:hypothetical protein
MISEYLNSVQDIVDKTLGRAHAAVPPAYDPLMTPGENEARAAYARSKTIQQRHGYVWQRSIGAYRGFEDLGEGHPSGLDIMNRERRIIMELKNATNTDNSSSRKTKLSLLADYKRDNPGWTAVYGCVFDHKNGGSWHKLVCHEGQSILALTGHALFSFLFGEDAGMVRNAVEDAVRSYKEKNDS